MLQGKIVTDGDARGGAYTSKCVKGSIADASRLCSQVKVITAGRPSKVIRPIHPGMEFVGLATLPNRCAQRCASLGDALMLMLDFDAITVCIHTDLPTMHRTLTHWNGS